MNTNEQSNQHESSVETRMKVEVEVERFRVPKMRTGVLGGVCAEQDDLYQAAPRARVD